MIKPSDIILSEYDTKGDHHPHRVVEAVLELHEVVTIDYRYRDDRNLISRAKETVRHRIYHKLYGDIRAPLEELYAIAMIKLPYSQELDKVSELKGEIDKIMRGEE